LVIEVSDSTLKYPQRTKLFLYAEAGISNYIKFLIIGYFISGVYNQREMHSELAQKRQCDFNYRSQRVVMQNEAVVIPGFTDLSRFIFGISSLG
jgi:hypothetical protein